MSPRHEADSLPSTEGRGRPLPERDRLTAEAALGAPLDLGPCAAVARNVLSLMRSSTTLAALLDALPRLLVDGLRLEGLAIQLEDPEPLRCAAAPGFEERFAAAVQSAAKAPGPASSDSPSMFRPPTTLRPLGALDGEDRNLYASEIAISEGRPGVLWVASIGAPSPPERQLLLDVAAVVGQLLSGERREFQLQHRIDAREEALGIVAHDLRNPIGAIGLAASSLLRRLPDTASRRTVERIVRAAHRVEKLLHDLLDIHAIEGGRFSLSRGWVDPTGLVLTALDSQTNLAGNSSVIIGTDIAPDLPTLEVDHERILQVLENLIGNALKFTPPGGTVTVAASAGAPGFVQFSVKDTGPGIDPSDLPHIFTRFWRGRRSGREGTGLGLAICRAIVDAHGGRIWAESTPGAGTSLHFTLPAAVAVPELDDRPTEPANILLVDDKPENLLALEAILAHPSYRLVKASSGKEALKLALRERFAVALIDVAMPEMNGLEVAEHLKTLERSRHTPIIFVTAFGNDPQEVHRAYAAGGADYLVKPMDPEIVRKKVAVFVELSRRRSEPGSP